MSFIKGLRGKMKKKRQKGKKKCKREGKQKENEEKDLSASLYSSQETMQNIFLEKNLIFSPQKKGREKAVHKIHFILMPIWAGIRDPPRKKMDSCHS